MARKRHTAEEIATAAFWRPMNGSPARATLLMFAACAGSDPTSARLASGLLSPVLRIIAATRIAAATSAPATTIAIGVARFLGDGLQSESSGGFVITMFDLKDQDR